MIKKTKNYIIKLSISAIALLLLGPYCMYNYFWASDHDESNNDYLSARREMFEKSISCKYGAPPVPFDNTSVWFQKISGTVKSKETKAPLKDIVLNMPKPGIKTVSDSDGKFAFEVYGYIMETLEIEARDGATGKTLGKTMVEFEEKNNSSFPGLDTYEIYMHNATVEILL